MVIMISEKQGFSVNGYYAFMVIVAAYACAFWLLTQRMPAQAVALLVVSSFCLLLAAQLVWYTPLYVQ